jgi:catechol 2,3-dioxygenase-like lactoylglutathione lyase family enzyme
LIHHVTRVVERTDVEPCTAFYGILGFRPVTMPEGIAERAVWLEAGLADGSGEAGDGILQAPAGGQQIHLMFGEAASPEAGHLALVCPDYDATIRALRDAGHDVEPRREHWGAPRAYVRDPAGNLVELMAWPPGAGPNATGAGSSDSV